MSELPSQFPQESIETSNSPESLQTFSVQEVRAALDVITPNHGSSEASIQQWMDNPSNIASAKTAQEIAQRYSDTVVTSTSGM